MSSSNKRGAVTGFDGIRGPNTAKRIANWNKNPPSGRWRKIEQVKLKYTYVVQTWTHLEKEYERKHLCPYGMKAYIIKLLEQECNSNKKAIPVEVREGLGLGGDADFDQNDVKLNCRDEGDKGFDTFYLLYCKQCKDEKMSKFAKKFPNHLPDSPTIKDIQDSWDQLMLVDPSIAQEVDVCGTLLPNDPPIIAGPNNRRFILRPVDHADKNKDVHFRSTPKVPAPKRPPPPPAAVDSIETPAKKNTFVPGHPEGKTHKQCTKVGKTADGKEIKVTVKSGHWNTTADIASLIDPSVSMFKVASNEDEDLAQDHCLSIILAGGNKNFSQEATMHVYQESVNAMRRYHKKKLGGIEIEGKKFRAPVKVQLHDKNISRIQKGIITAYKEMNSPTAANKAPYAALKDGPFGKFFSIMNDGIQKFCREYNGVFIWTVDADLNVANLPWALSDIPDGSMDHTKLTQQLLKMISVVKKFRDSSFNDAETEFLHLFAQKYPDVIAPSELPAIFICTVIESCDFDAKKIELCFDEWPVALVADGCSVNPKAAKWLFEIYGLLSPGTRCSGHSAIGSVRRMTSSKTMQVEAVVTFVGGLRPVLRHFQLSGKSSALLNDALEIMEMKPLKAMTWSPTRMGNVLTSSQRTVDILFPLCDVLASTGIKAEESAYFLSPTCLTLLHLMADLEPVFMQKFLRKLDTNDATLFEVYGMTENFVSAMKELKTPLLDEFLNGLKEDAYGNVLYDKVDKDGNSNTIILNYSHRPSRHAAPNERIDGGIKVEAAALKERVVENLIWNAEDQNQSSTIVEYASLFDLTRKCDKTTRISFLKQLHLIYSKEYIHTVVDDEAKGDLYEFSITVKYPPKLKCSEDELIAEFNSIWSTVSKSWLKFKDSKPAVSHMRRFWVEIISEHAIEYPNICDLLLLLLAVSPGTGPVERSFSKLAKICYKDRGNTKGHTMEALYLLSAMEIKEDDEDFLKRVKNLLQKK